MSGINDFRRHQHCCTVCGEDTWSDGMPRLMNNSLTKQTRQPMSPGAAPPPLRGILFPSFVCVNFAT